MRSTAFFFNDPATTEIYTLSLHDALPISRPGLRARRAGEDGRAGGRGPCRPVARRIGAGRVGVRRWQRDRAAGAGAAVDRKSTRLNSSHSQISYAVFCLKKKKD